MPFLFEDGHGGRPTKSLNCHGRLIQLDEPQVMGIINVTPDSFYAGSRKQTERDIIEQALRITTEGGTMIDVGAYSTRPGAAEVTAAEEMDRLRRGLEAIRRELPETIISVDTFRSDVAAMCVEEYGVDIVNDISGGTLDREMFRTVARLHVPYVLMHIQGTPRHMQDNPTYRNVTEDVTLFLARRMEELHRLGVSDIIVDPGYGFGKKLEDNYELLLHADALRELNQPILVGVSRKSMIYRLLDTTPEEALNGTTVVNTISLLRGADILRVHDVRPAVEAVRIVTAMRRQS